MRSCVVAVLLAVAAVIAAGSPAAAKPMHTPLAEIVKQSTAVVIARFVRPPDPNAATSYELVVERALRGAVKPGRFVAKASRHGHAHFAADARLVAFIDASDEWLAYAELAAGPTLERGVLRAAGFYDWNAHLVTPGVMTLAQLEALVQRGTPLAWTFRGPILVGSPSGLVASALEVTVTAPRASVRGLPAGVRLGAPEVTVGSWPGSDVTVEWAAGARALELEGTATGLHADGSIAVRYRLRAPGLLPEAELRRYLTEPALGAPYHELVLERGATKIPVTLGEELRTSRIGGEPLAGVSSAPERQITSAASKIELAATGYRAGSIGATDSLVEELMAGPVGCTVTARGASAPCTLRYVATRFAPPPRP